MPHTDEERDAIKANIAVARKRDLNFALCQGKQPEGTILKLDRKRKPDMLAKQAKKDGDTPKVAFGTLSVKGKKAIFACEESPPPGFAKKTKQFFRTMNMKFGVVIADTSGNILESEVDADEEEDDQNAAATQPEDTSNEQSSGPDSSAWDKVAKAFTPLVEKAVAAGGDRGPKIAAAWKMAEDAAGNEDYAGAIKIAQKIKPALTEAPDNNEDPDAKRWAADAPRVEELLNRVLAAGAGDTSKFRAAWGMAAERADGGDFSGAMKVLDRLEPLLQDAASNIGDENRNAEADAAIPKDVVPFVKSRLLWIDSRKKLFDEMKKLENAITAAVKDDEELAPLANEVSSLTDRLRPFDARLEETLEKMVETPDGDAREQLKRQAKSAIGDYAKVLQEDFFKDVDSNNGFVSVAVASTARNALGAIAKTLG